MLHLLLPASELEERRFRRRLGLACRRAGRHRHLLCRDRPEGGTAGRNGGGEGQDRYTIDGASAARHRWEGGNYLQIVGFLENEHDNL